MKSQNSFAGTTGILYLVATPIGNLEDMTFRAIRILQEADMIAAEDTRNTKKLCNHFDIQTPLFSYHEHNLLTGGDKIMQALIEGKNVALVSDAGMPCISDPGADIAKRAITDGFPVVPVPGANAALSALIASGLPSQPFTFYGFLSRKKKERKDELEALKTKRETLLFYEAPHRLKETLKDMEEIIGSEREIVLARELTKKFEEFLRGSVGEALTWAQEQEVRGEFCIVLRGFEGEEESPNLWWSDLSLTNHVEQVMEMKGVSSKEAIKEVAAVRGLSKRDVYQEYHIE